MIKDMGAAGIIFVAYGDALMIAPLGFSAGAVL